jgi:hypothetical protein
VFCTQSSVLGAPEPAPQAGPTFIVVHTHTDDGDQAGPRPSSPAVAHANVAHRMSWLVWLGAVLLLTMGGGGAAFLRCGKHSALLSKLVWDGSEPLVCSSNDDIAVTSVAASFSSGSAIQASGNCHVRCTDCTITAPTAIEASGNAQITLVNGTIRGTSVLADATGNARVTISGNVTVAGRVRESGSAKVSAPPPAAEPATAASAAASAPAQKAAASAAPGAAARPAKGQGSPPRPKATAGK